MHKTTFLLSFYIIKFKQKKIFGTPGFEPSTSGIIAKDHNCSTMEPINKANTNMKINMKLKSCRNKNKHI